MNLIAVNFYDLILTIGCFVTAVVWCLGQEVVTYHHSLQVSVVVCAPQCVAHCDHTAVHVCLTWQNP